MAVETLPIEYDTATLDASDAQEEAVDIEMLLRSVQFPSEADIQAVGEGRACFLVERPSLVLTVAKVWGEVLKETGRYDPYEVDRIRHNGMLGLMNRREDLKVASNALERPIMDIARFRMHRDH